MSFLGNPVRQIVPKDKQEVAYLSFDDGPNAELTPRVLDMLNEFQAKATFFVITERAKANQEVLKRIVDEGHAIGNHSTDHRYSVFFKSYQEMYSWVKAAEDDLTNLGIKNSVGFRPPVGIRTPKLARALKELKLPLILWKQRSYDGIFRFSSMKANKIINQCKSGDIILLHDRQKTEWEKDFLDGLRTLLTGLSNKGFLLPKLERNITK